jgi:hypothetical protein
MRKSKATKMGTSLKVKKTLRFTNISSKLRKTAKNVLKFKSKSIRK